MKPLLPVTELDIYAGRDPHDKGSTDVISWLACINLSIGPCRYFYVDGSVDSSSDFVTGQPRHYRPGDGDRGGLFFSIRPSCMAGEFLILN